MSGMIIEGRAFVFGDGVNIASRIEPLAPSCGICVSEDVARQVQNKIDFPLKRIDFAIWPTGTPIRWAAFSAVGVDPGSNSRLTLHSGCEKDI